MERLLALLLAIPISFSLHQPAEVSNTEAVLSESPSVVAEAIEEYAEGDVGEEVAVVQSATEETIVVEESIEEVTEAPVKVSIVITMQDGTEEPITLSGNVERSIVEEFLELMEAPEVEDTATTVEEAPEAEDTTTTVDEVPKVEEVTAEEDADVEEETAVEEKEEVVEEEATVEEEEVVEEETAVEEEVAAEEEAEEEATVEEEEVVEEETAVEEEVAAEEEVEEEATVEEEEVVEEETAVEEEVAAEEEVEEEATEATETEEVTETTEATEWNGEVLKCRKGFLENGPTGYETWYDLDTSQVVKNMKEKHGIDLDYWIDEETGLKMYGDYIMVAADARSPGNPNGTFEYGDIIETSYGTAMVVDCCRLAITKREQSGKIHIDIATDWAHTYSIRD